ncbi:hypothetical protein, partial [Tsukamurella pulmonis]|uniref:hypothetical protein n=1 Tax=Tsukamurella pulmonis TaxID=47312 RepID=UPI000E17F193
MLECDLVVADGYTAARVRSAIARAYTALVQGDPLPVAPIRPLRALQEAEEAYLASPDHAVDAAFWKSTALPGPAERNSKTPSRIAAR